MKMLVITFLKTLEHPFVSRDKLDWKGEGLRKFVSVTYIVIIEVDALSRGINGKNAKKA